MPQRPCPTQPESLSASVTKAVPLLLTPKYVTYAMGNSRLAAPRHAPPTPIATGSLPETANATPRRQACFTGSAATAGPFTAYPSETLPNSDAAFT
ncbi:hypothetical protein MMC22_004421 [Lobaria immixta]|nr:hypothetical protein [Lobaria immixta]